MRTPIKSARGLGSAKSGVHHWTMQRVTAVALIPLGLWFVISMMCTLGASYDKFVEWVACPWNTGGLILFFAAMFYHSMLGIQVVVEDYVHAEGLKIATLLVIRLIQIGLGVTSVIAILNIAFTGG